MSTGSGSGPAADAGRSMRALRVPCAVATLRTERPVGGRAAEELHPAEGATSTEVTLPRPAGCGRTVGPGETGGTQAASSSVARKNAEAATAVRSFGLG